MLLFGPSPRFILATVLIWVRGNNCANVEAGDGLHKQRRPNKVYSHPPLLRREDNDEAPVRSEQGQSEANKKRRTPLNQGNYVPSIMTCIDTCRHVKKFDVKNRLSCIRLQTCDTSACSVKETQRLRHFFIGGCDYGALPRNAVKEEHRRKVARRGRWGGRSRVRHARRGPRRVYKHWGATKDKQARKRLRHVGVVTGASKAGKPKRVAHWRRSKKALANPQAQKSIQHEAVAESPQKDGAATSARDDGEPDHDAKASAATKELASPQAKQHASAPTVHQDRRGRKRLQKVGAAPGAADAVDPKHVGRASSSKQGSKWEYEQLQGDCSNPNHIGDNINVTAIDQCQDECDKNPECLGFNSDGKYCYLKRQCVGKVGAGGVGYRRKVGSGHGGCSQNTSTRCTAGGTECGDGSLCALGADSTTGWCLCSGNGCYSKHTERCSEAPKGSCLRVTMTACEVDEDCNQAQSQNLSVPAVCVKAPGEKGECHCLSQGDEESCAWMEKNDDDGDMICLKESVYWEKEALRRREAASKKFPGHRSTPRMATGKAIVSPAGVPVGPSALGGPAGPPGPPGPPGPRGMVKFDFPLLAEFHVIFALNMIVAICGCYWTQRNLIDRKPPYGIKVSSRTLKTLPPGGFPDVGDDPEDSDVELIENEHGGSAGGRGGGVAAAAEGRQGEEETRGGGEEVYTVAGAGLDEYNGRYVKSHEDRDGVAFWMKKKTEEPKHHDGAENAQRFQQSPGDAHEHIDAHEIWRENGMWVLGYWPTDHAKDKADDHDVVFSTVLQKTVMWVADGEGAELPPEGCWKAAHLVEGSVVLVDIPAVAEDPPNPHHQCPTVMMALEVVAAHEKVIDKGECPNDLYVICSHGWSGHYVKIPDRIVAGYPIWKHESSKDWIFSSRSGHWMVGDEDEKNQKFDCDSGNVCYMRPHKGVRWPHQVTAGRWRRFDGMQWVQDESIKVQVTPEPFSVGGAAASVVGVFKFW